MFKMYDTNLETETAACSRLYSYYSDSISSDLEAGKESKKWIGEAHAPILIKNVEKRKQV